MKIKVLYNWHPPPLLADMLGRLEQAADYYPYGELWRLPSGSSANAFLFEGKERLTADGIRVIVGDSLVRLAHTPCIWDEPETSVILVI